MNRGIIGALALMAFLFLALPAHAACSVSTEAGVLSDLDCDRTPDVIDNCPSVANAEQHDMNRNGIGDACDAAIEELRVSPDTSISQGEFATITIRALNSQDGPITDLAILISNTALGIEEFRSLDLLPAGESASIDVSLKIPECARIGNHELTIRTEYLAPYTHERVTEETMQDIFVERGSCRSTGSLDDTQIDTFGALDLDRGGSGIIPITITNMHNGPVTYHAAVNDLGDWGTWRIDPVHSMQLPAGHSHTFFLYLETQEGTSAGTRTVEMTITADGQTTTVPIRVYVRGARGRESPFASFGALGVFWPKLLLLLIVMLIIGALLLLVILHLVRRNRTQPYKTVVAFEEEPTEAASAKKTSATKKKSAKKTAPRKKVAVEKVDADQRETYY